MMGFLIKLFITKLLNINDRGRRSKEAHTIKETYINVIYAPVAQPDRATASNRGRYVRNNIIELIKFGEACKMVIPSQARKGRCRDLMVST
jgi:hypothetical protein